MGYISRALFFGALFCGCNAYALCPPDRIDETAVVRHVHDGDTLHLSDGRKVRLIGIDTPEVARKQAPAEPLANEARNALRQLLRQHDNKIGLKFGLERQDKYQRLLAHLYLPDGQSVQAHLLNQGYAVAFTTPPNDRNADCYRQAEQNAIDAKRGVWGLADYQLKTTYQLTDKDRGFRRIQGRVTKLSQSSKGVWLFLDQNIRIQIKQQDVANFNSYMLQQLEGKTIIVRGWLHPGENGFYLNLRHPDAISHK
ncbi:MAG TPA: thermonuclease family protein [Gammaproteobacteria bacterium]